MILSALRDHPYQSLRVLPQLAQLTQQRTALPAVWELGSPALNAVPTFANDLVEAPWAKRCAACGSRGEPKRTVKTISSVVCFDVWNSSTQCLETKSLPLE